MKTTNETKHTPGNPCSYGFINNFSGSHFAYGLRMSDLTITPPEGCKIGLNMGNLIAAAPEMIAALEYIEQHCVAGLSPGGNVHLQLNLIAASARDILAKAKGQL